MSVLSYPSVWQFSVAVQISINSSNWNESPCGGVSCPRCVQPCAFPLWLKIRIIDKTEIQKYLLFIARIAWHKETRYVGKNAELSNVKHHHHQ